MARVFAGSVLFLLNTIYPAAAGAGQPHTEGAGQRPNILLAIADDWGWPHAGAYGDKVVSTPNFDRLARQGVLFRHAYVAAPTCTASRGAILAGQPVHRLAEGANLFGTLPKIEVYPDLLEKAGYAVGYTGKGWGPGRWKEGGWTRNPAGPKFNGFRQFLEQLPDAKPFCFWFGSRDPHRPYARGSGAKAGMDPQRVVVPAYLPDTPTVRSDFLDYYFEVQRFDRQVGELIELLETAGKLDNTLIVVTGDNGIPFPRAKVTLYDGGTRVPLVVCWRAKAGGGRVVDDFVNLSELAPTFLEAAGLKAPPEMIARSLLDVVVSTGSGRVDARRDKVFTERERDGWSRRGGLSYPVRAVRTHEFLYIRNLRPNLWPSGDPGWPTWEGEYGDVDRGPTKGDLLERRHERPFARHFQRAFGKRPPEELYDLGRDPWQVNNVSGQPEYAAPQEELRAELERWMHRTSDPRAEGETDFWDTARWFGPTHDPTTGRKAPR